MDSLTELKQNEDLVINSKKIEEEIDAYFDNISFSLFSRSILENIN